MLGFLPIGPYEEISVRNGNTAPFYMMPFDKKGRCKGPKTRQHMLEAIRDGNFSNVFIFSHGWNNTFDDAVTQYEKFVHHFQAVKPVGSELDSPEYRPFLIGISWPSISLVLPWDRGPGIQSAAPGARPRDFNRQVGDQQAELDLVADLLAEDDVEDFYRIAATEGPMSESDAVALARLLAPLYGEAEDPTEAPGEAPSADELIAFWRGPVMEAQADAMASMGASAPAPAGIFDNLPDPRDALRVFTVYKMKDRAGKVGATGVANLLSDILQASSGAKVHLIGHSYGSKVLLSAVTVPQSLPRPVTSALLLQPAVNAYCFAPNVLGKGFAGGYFPALQRIEQPILSTFSENDLPLTTIFHLALRRKADLGEVRISNAAAPSEFAALGGYGAHGCTEGDYSSISIKPVGELYPLHGASLEVLGVCGDNVIDGHNDVVNDATAWALYCQVKESGA